MTDAATAQAQADLTQAEADLREAASLFYVGHGAISTLTHAAAQYGKAQETFLAALGQG